MRHDQHSEGEALTTLGNALQEVGRFEEAITACQQAAQIFRDTGDQHSETIALRNLQETMEDQEAAQRGGHHQTESPRSTEDAK
jgi:tetratricopeptide (TPR) repeat protein